LPSWRPKAWQNDRCGNIPAMTEIPELSLDLCIKCNICTTACPVSGVTDLFPGPKFEAPQGGRFRQADQPTPDKSVDYCSGCRVCNMVCPTGVKIAEMNARARAMMVTQGKVKPVLRLRNNLVARAELLGKVAQPVAPMANGALSFAPARALMEKMLGIARHAPLPRFSSQRFTTWYRRHLAENQTKLNRAAIEGINAAEYSGGPGYRGRGERPQVVYFHGCSTQYYEPRVGRAAVHVLEANGFEVLLPKQNCCGLPLLSNGEFAAARRYHTSNVRYLVEYARRGIPIVGTSTSCTLTLKEEAPELLDMYNEDTRLVARQTYDFNEFLLLLLEEGRLNLELKPLLPEDMSLTLPYHIPCQYRAHRLGKPGIEVLDLIPGLQVIDSHAPCCGIAGTYGYKQEKYDISMKVGEPLFEFIQGFGAPLAVCDSETCRWQITHATGLPAVHPVELLAASYGYEAGEALTKALDSLRNIQQ
jgi:glycerol-3-phosphate dehydrogenase subunit C